MAELTEAQRAHRRQQAHNAIETRLRDTYTAWKRTGRRPDFPLAADLALDSLGDLAAEILTDGTLFKSLNIQDGVVTIETEPAREILLTLVASMRTMLDSYGAENYLETEITAPPSVALDLRDGKNPTDDYTVTIQRRTRPTPHEFRQRAEGRLTAVLAECDAIEEDWHGGHRADAEDVREAVRRIRAAATGLDIPAPTTPGYDIALAAAEHHARTRHTT